MKPFLKIQGGISESIDTAPLQRRHEKAMLSLVMQWAALDGVLGLLLSKAMGITPADGADQIGKMPTSGKLVRVKKALKDGKASSSLVSKISKSKDDYEEYSIVRNRICHSHCIGIARKNHDLIVFAVFERSQDKYLSADWIPISLVEKATQWGRALQDDLYMMLDDESLWIAPAHRVTAPDHLIPSIPPE